MNKKFILSWLSIAILVVTTFSSSAVAAAETGGPAAPVLQDDDDTPTPEPTEPPVVTVTPGVFPPPEDPLIPTETKPSLEFTPVELPPQGVLAYTLPIDTPNWTIPLKAAASPNISPVGGFTPVGMVQMDSNPETESEPVTYLVMIDLQSTADLVQGQLFALTTMETVDITFQRIPQELNPARIDSPFSEFQELGLGNQSVTIYADGVCFVVQMNSGSGNGGGSDDDRDNGSHDDDNGTGSNSTNSSSTYVRYCSRPTSPDGAVAPLSVMDNFPTQYDYLQDLVRDVAQSFDLEDRIQLDEIISTIESIQGLQDCVSGSTSDACSSDIVGAPVKDEYFNRQFQREFGGNGDGDDDDDGENGDRESQTVSSNTAGIAANNGEDGDDGENGNGGNGQPSLPGTPIEVAVVKVLKPIEIPNGIIQPGDYLVHWWFDSNKVFYAATLTGVTTDNTQVTNQQIPAVPATFIDKKGEGPKQPASQISGWVVRFRGREYYVCKIVENC